MTRPVGSTNFVFHRVHRLNLTYGRTVCNSWLFKLKKSNGCDRHVLVHDYLLDFTFTSIATVEITGMNMLPFTSLWIVLPPFPLFFSAAVSFSFASSPLRDNTEILVSTSTTFFGVNNYVTVAFSSIIAEVEAVPFPFRSFLHHRRLLPFRSHLAGKRRLLLSYLYHGGIKMYKSEHNKPA